MTIKIFVNNDISPEFVEPQLASFKKYLQEDFEYTICGGEAVARKPEKAKQVTQVCRSLGVPIIDIQRDDIVMSHCKEMGGGHPNEAIFSSDGRYLTNIQASYATQWTWEKVIAKQQGLVGFIHSDVFLMEPIKFSDYVDKHDMCSTVKHRAQMDGEAVHDPLTYLRHLWEVFMLLDMSKFPEPETVMWWGGLADGTWMPDGGGTYLYLKAHPGLDILEIQPAEFGDDLTTDFHPSRYQFLPLKEPGIADKTVFHYLAGCRWATDEMEWTGVLVGTQDEYHAKKLAWTRRLIGV